MFRNIKEIYEHTDLKGQFYNEARTQAIEICKQFKENFLLKYLELPEEPVWKNVSPNQSFTSLIFSYALSQVEQDMELFDKRESARSVIAMLMWMFDIKKEELLEEQRKKLKMVNFTRLMLGTPLAKDLIGKTLSRFGNKQVVGKIINATDTGDVDKDGNALFSFEAEMDEDSIDEIRSCDRHFGECLTINCDKFVHIKPEQAKEYSNNSQFTPSSVPNYHTVLREGEIGMLDGQRIIVDSEKVKTKDVCFEIPLQAGMDWRALPGRSVTKDGKVVGEIFSSSLSGAEENPMLKLVVRIKENAWNEIASSSKLLRDSLEFNSDSSQEENNSNGV